MKLNNENANTHSLAESNPVANSARLNDLLVIILSVLLLISMSVSGFFAYQTQTLVKELTLLKSSPTPVSSIEPTLGTTADWKIYVNNDFDFSFYYPKDYKLVNDGWEKIGDNPKGHYVINMDDPSSDFSINIDIRNSSSRLGGNYKEITVAGTVAYEDLDSVGKYVFFEKDGYSYDVQVLSLDSNKTNTEANLVFDRILSTFKFTNTVDEGVEIKAIFEKVNKELNTKITIDEQNSFYDSRFGQINKKSWLLDLSNVINDKSKVNMVEEVLISSSMTLDPTRSASGSEASVDAFVGDDVLCYLIIEPLKKKLNCAVNK